MSIQRAKDVLENILEGEDLVRFAQGGKLAANRRDNDRPRKIDGVERFEHFVDGGNVPA